MRLEGFRSKSRGGLHLSEFTYAVGDIHGRLDLLTSAIAAIEADAPHGTVVFLGDYIDRGSDSCGVIERLINGPRAGWRWICLKGNHEAMMTEAYSGDGVGSWLANGGEETLASYGGTIPEFHVAWCAALPLLHRDNYRVYVHAAIDPSLPLFEKAQREAVLLWKRYKPHEDVHADLHVVHGHTPIKNGPVKLSGRTNLDVGAVFNDRLAIGVFDDSVPGGPTRILSV